jgi:hypothetical protein
MGNRASIHTDIFARGTATNSHFINEEIKKTINSGMLTPVQFRNFSGLACGLNSSRLK